MPFDPSAPFEIIEAPPRFDPSKPFEIVDSPSPPVSTSEGLKSSLERGWMALKNVPGTIALAAKSDLGDSGAVRYAADRASRGQVMDALLAAGQDPTAQTEAYFRTGPEAVIRQRQAEIAKPVIERLAASEALPRSEAQQRLQTAQGAKEKFKTWARDPVELTASIILESLPSSLAGAAVGSLGGPTGMIAGVGLSSGLSTFSSELLGNAASRGVNIQDTDAVVNWLNSPQFDEDFKSAATKSAVVGAIDSVTAGKAGSFISPAIKQGLKKAAVASGKEVALQAAGGAAGEALGSVVAGQPVDPFNVFVEAIAEVGSAPGEVAGNLRKSRRGGFRGRESILRRGTVPVAETPSVEPVVEAPITESVPIVSKSVIDTPVPESEVPKPVPLIVPMEARTNDEAFYRGLLNQNVKDGGRPAAVFTYMVEDGFPQAEALRLTQDYHPNFGSTEAKIALEKRALQNQKTSSPTPIAPPPSPTVPLADAERVAAGGTTARPFVIEREGIETSKFGVPEKVIPQIASGFKPPKMPERFDSLDAALAYREAQEAAEVEFFKSLGLSEQDARRMFKAGDSRSNLDVSKIESKLTPENSARLEAFSTGEGAEMYQWDRTYDPSSLQGITDKAELAQQVVANLQRESQPNEFGDKLVHAAVALRQLKDNGGTWRDVAVALDNFTTRNSGSQGDKAEYFEGLAQKIKAFAARQGIELPLEPSKQIGTTAGVAEVGVAEVPKDAPLMDLLGAKHDLTVQQAGFVLQAFRALPRGAKAEALQKEYLRLATPSDMPMEVGLGKVAGLAGAKEVLSDLREASAGDTALPVRQTGSPVGRNERKSPPTGQPDEGARETGTLPQTKTTELPAESGRVAASAEPLTAQQPREVISGETVAPVKTAVESQKSARENTPAQLRAELAQVTKEISELPKPKTLADLEAQAPLKQRAGFLREALEIQEQAATTAFDPKRIPTVEFKVKDLTLSADVPNFKGGAREDTGTVAGQELAGKYERTGTAPIVAWQRLNGKTEVITGRHRLDLARRSGEKTIPTQIVREADGFTKDMALTFDAEANIRDGQGEVTDYATYFKGTNISEAEARTRGLLSRAKGKAGWSLAKAATDDIYALWRNGKITDAQAVAIAESAPGDAAAQRIGSKFALQGKSADFISNVIKASQTEAGTRAQSLDLFGNDDAAMTAMAAQAERASQFQSELGEQIRAVQGAAKRPELARKLGVDVKDPAGIVNKIAELKAEQVRWENWPLQPDLVAKVRGAVPEVATPTPAAKSSELFASQDTPFNLAGEKSEAPPAPSEFGGFGNDRLAQSEMFAIQKIVEHKDPAKSADAAQQLYGGAREAAQKIQAQLDVLDSMPKADALKAFNKEQRTRLKEVVALLRERSQTFRETAESIAEKLEGIKSGRQPGDLQLFGVIPAVWDEAIRIAQNIIRNLGTAADAIKAALEYIRANNKKPFEEQKATEFIERVVQPQTQFQEPDANEAEPAAAQTVNIAGRAYEVISKDKLTDEQRKAVDTKAQEKLAELGIPGAPDATDDTRAGSINNNTVFRVVSDGQNHDAAVQALRTHLVDEIQRQHSQGGDPAYVGSLINAINMNFDLGRWQDVVSQSVLESLLDVSVGESSKSGTMLRRFRGISEDVRAVAQNAALRLKWEYAKALDPENYAKGALSRVVEGIRRHFTENEITSLARKIAKPEDAEPVVAALRKAIAGDFTSMSDVMKAAQAALIEAGMTEAQARKIVSEAETILSNTVRDGANAAIAQMKAELTPVEKRGAAGRALNEIQKMMLNDVFGYGDLLTRLAKSERWVVPSAKEFEQMRKWAKDEQALRTPSADEIARHGGFETATDMVSAATLGVRRDLLRKMSSQWSLWTNPLTTSWRDTSDSIKVKNSNMAFSEWVSANLLFKVGFATRQTWDVLSQMMLNTPTRAISYAFEAWQNDKASGRDSSLQHSIAEAITDAYQARIKVLVPALNAFKETLVGRGEHKKQVEQLVSSIGIFDRALMNAARMRSESKRGAANLLEIIALTTRMGRQFAAAMDALQGLPAETQEIAHQVRNALREKGLTGAELEVQYDSIIGLLSSYRAEAISLARETLEIHGVEAKSGELEMAAGRILKEKLYHAAKQAGLRTDDWKKQNEVYRELIGWNLPETGGSKGVGGFGGLVALGGKAAKEMLSHIPIVGGLFSVPFTFSNAMGISLNRKLAWSPLGFFPGIFKGSPHWEGETNIRQRKIEAVLGTGISATVFSLIVAGVWKALPAFWPKDEKERERWVKNGWAPGMVLIPWGNGQELHISTRVGPLAFFSPAIAAAAAYTHKVEERAKKQAVSDARAKRMGLKPEPLPDLSATDWMGIMLAAAYSSVTGGRTASGALAAYTDYGTFNIKKAAASVTGAVLPGFPALNEFGRMAGANINPKLATFWDLLVPMPTSDAQRVNMLGDPMRDENDYRRVFQILSGGNFPFPTSATPAETQAYAALFESDYRPPAINPGRGYNIGGRYRPFTSEELSKYTAARGQAFKRELGALGASPSSEEIKSAFVRANDAALASVGVAVPVRAAARTTGRRTRSASRFRLGRARRGRSLRLGRRGLRGLRKRRKRLVLR